MFKVTITPPPGSRFSQHYYELETDSADYASMFGEGMADEEGSLVTVEQM
jgi:hypothetical protein